jgi:hypothetical protein
VEVLGIVICEFWFLPTAELALRTLVGLEEGLGGPADLLRVSHVGILRCLHVPSGRRPTRFEGLIVEADQREGSLHVATVNVCEGLVKNLLLVGS